MFDILKRKILPLIFRGHNFDLVIVVQCPATIVVVFLTKFNVYRFLENHELLPRVLRVHNWISLVGRPAMSELLLLLLSACVQSRTGHYIGESSPIGGT